MTPTSSTPLSLRGKRWIIASPDPDPEHIRRLSTAVSLPEAVARLLLQRGLADGPAAAAFLRPEFKTLHDPSLLPNMAAAVERIAAAVAAQEKIVIFGDYDVDGTTGTAMLWHTLTAAGADVHTYIPHRVEEGYGLSVPALDQLIDAGAQLIITVDCGISGHAPITRARERNVDVIVTDHHEIPETLPPAHTIVHPRLPGATGLRSSQTRAEGGESSSPSVRSPCLSASVVPSEGGALAPGPSPLTPSSYPNPHLCGAGVAYKLAWALATRFCGGGKVNDVYRNLLVEFAALAGLATIADVVPLVGENRVLVKYGLAQVPHSKLLGLQALVEAAGYRDKKIDGLAVGFGLAPRLNAAGRMDHADLVIELLTRADAARAKEIAAYLEEQNQDRQVCEKRMFALAQKEVESWPALPPVLVVAAEAHHAGVVGIVASRLVDAYHRPAFVLACAGDDCHGSGRSIPGFEMHRAIDACRHLLVSGGGHAMAGGIRLKLANLPALRDALTAYAAPILTADHFIPTLELDGPLALADATLGLVGCLEQFEPCGRGNPAPRFIIENVQLTAPPRRVGATGAHVQFQFQQGGATARGIAFKMGDLVADLKPGMAFDLAVEPKLDTYNGRSKVDFIILDLRPL